MNGAGLKTLGVTPIGLGSLLVLCALLGSGPLWAQECEVAAQPPGYPLLIPFQGRLVDGSGTPRDGEFHVTFKIFDAPGLGTQKWFEVHDSVSINDGQVNVFLGGGVGQPLEQVTWEGERFLEITIRPKGQGNFPAQPLVPRHQLVPFFRARVADTVPDCSITANKLAPGALTIEKIVKTVDSDEAAFRVTNAGDGTALHGHTVGGFEGVYGESQRSGGIGVRGVTNSQTGQGVVGLNIAPGTNVPYSDGANSGVFGYSQNGPNSTGVYGEGQGTGVYGFTPAGTAGVRGYTNGSNAGVAGRAEGTGGLGVIGEAPTGVGVRGESDSGYGVVGQTKNDSRERSGVQGLAPGAGLGVSGIAGTNGIGVQGSAGGTGIGVRGRGTFNGGVGVQGENEIGVAVQAVGGEGDSPALQVFSDALNLIRAGNQPFTAWKFILDQSGRGKFANGTQTGLSDLAELVDASDALEPGDVVEIDPGRSESFRRAATSFSTLAAGIVSTAPGVTLGMGVEEEPSPTRSALALAGRVPTKVTTINGPIQVGDLLTTSAVPGHAMRCDDRLKCVGAIVGKALEPLESGDGRIQVLITLQ